MKKLWEKLAGKKTHFATAGAILTAIAGVLGGELTPLQGLLVLFGGGAVSAVRAGVATDVKKLKED